MTVTAPETTQERFSSRLKESTKHVHDNAEHSTFMEDLMGGSLNTEAYLRLINQYVHIYEALEAVSEHYRAEPSPTTDPLTHPGRADIRALGQDGDIDAPLPATAEYVERIRATINSPERYLAHHYLRYLGDLSGGQAVAALAPRHYGIPAEALSMYRFTELPKPKVFKDGYRELLDNAPLTDEQREALIEECVEGFRINASLFAQLGRKVAEA